MSDEKPVSIEEDAWARDLIHKFSVYRGSKLLCCCCDEPFPDGVEIVENLIYSNIERAADFLKKDITIEVCCGKCTDLGVCHHCRRAEESGERTGEAPGPP